MNSRFAGRLFNQANLELLREKILLAQFEGRVVKDPVLYEHILGKLKLVGERQDGK